MSWKAKGQNWAMMMHHSQSQTVWISLINWHSRMRQFKTIFWIREVNILVLTALFFQLSWMFKNFHNKNGMQILQKIKLRLAIWPRNSTFGYIIKINESRGLERYLYTHVDSRIIPNSQRWEQSKCPKTDEWIDKCIYYIYKMEYYSAL